MFSSASIHLVGDNSLMEDLRALSCTELFLFSSYYATHPVFNKVFTQGQVQGEVLRNFNAVFDSSLSLNDNEYPFGASL